MKRDKKEQENLPRAKSGTFFKKEPGDTFFAPQSGQADHQESKTPDAKVTETVSKLVDTDLSQVKINESPEARQRTEAVNAKALNYGEEISFAGGQQQAGTPGGNALLAHEIAHAAQQEGATHGKPVLDHDSRMEKEANSVAMGAATALQYNLNPKKGSRQKLSKGKKRVMRACTSSERIEPPAYLGPHSITTLQHINDIVENTELLGKVIVGGVALVEGMAGPDERAAALATGGVGGNVEMAAQAIRGIPAIRRYRVNQEIDLLFLQHENDMNAQEKAFWNRIRRMFNEAN